MTRGAAWLSTCSTKLFSMDKAYPRRRIGQQQLEPTVLLIQATQLPANDSLLDNPSVPASGDCAVKVSSDHRPEFLTPGLEDGGIKQLGRPAIGCADVDLGLRTAGQEGDSEFRKLSQPQRRNFATMMQCDQPVSHRLVVDADLRPARSHAGELGG